MPIAAVGTGASLTFGSSFVVEVLDIKHGGMERASIDSSHLGTSSARTFIPGKLYDPGETTVECLWDADAEDPTALLTATSTTVTITFPIPSGRSAGATLTGNGFLRAVSEIAVPLEDKMTMTYSIKWTGTVSKTTST